jgi:hypothetical protein
MTRMRHLKIARFDFVRDAVAARRLCRKRRAPGTRERIEYDVARE